MKNIQNVKKCFLHFYNMKCFAKFTIFERLPVNKNLMRLILSRQMVQLEMRNNG